MNCADPPTLDEWDQIVTPFKAEAATNAFSHLTRGPRREGDGEHLCGQVVALCHRAHVALDEDGGFTRPGPSIDEDTARCLYSSKLRRRKLVTSAARGHSATRQMPR